VVAAGAVIGFGQLAVVRRAGGDHFDAMAVVYLDAVVALPLIAATLLLGGLIGRRWGVPRLGPIASLLAVVVLLAAPLGFYTTHIEPYAVSVERVARSLPSERAGDDVVRIGVLTDLQTTHIGDYEHRAVDLLNEAEPDVVLIGGDLFQGTPGQFEANQDELRRLLTGIDAPGGVYVVEGDTDDAATLDAMFSGTSVTYLWNQVVEAQVGDRTLRIAGLGNNRGRDYRFGIAAIEQLEAAPPSTVTVALGHRPDWVFDVPDGRADLVVAGHTHGGQIQLPFIGPLMTLTEVPREVAAGGLHEVGGTPIYVSHGVGHEQQGAPQIRFLAPPNVGLIELG
jgi:predicted MPP superfamily phosphohydrolase